MWISRFEWPDKDMAEVRTRIDEIMGRLQEHNFNAAVFQVRGQMDTFYPSPEEPWSPIVSPDGNTPPGWDDFDPMVYAIESARSHGIEFHAYINTHVIWQSTDKKPPAYSDAHPFWRYTNAADPEKRAWLIHDENGEPVQFSESDYVWAAPGVPEFQAYTRRQIMHVVDHYDVDGIHLDRIRTPSSRGPAGKWSNDPISRARFESEGNPHGLEWTDWMPDQTTRMLQDLYAQIMEVRPRIQVSSAPLGLYRPTSYAQYDGYPQGHCSFQYGYTCTSQDAQGWLAAGAHDFIVPQIYWPDPPGRTNKPHFSEVLPDWLANAHGRHVYAGTTTAMGDAPLVSGRSLGSTGSVVFSYGGFNRNNLWSVFSGSGGVYEHPADPPPMPWKTDPQHGIIIGNITSEDGQPIVDAWINYDGSSYTALSSADGLYSFLLVEPGTYALTFTKTGYETQTMAGLDVQAGEVARLNITLLPVDRDVEQPHVAAAQTPPAAVAVQPETPADQEPVAVVSPPADSPDAARIAAPPLAEPRPLPAEPKPVLAVSRRSFERSIEMRRDSSGATDRFSVTNIALRGSTMSYSIDVDAGWLTCTPDSGSLAGRQSNDISITYTWEDLEPGTHTALVTVNAPDAGNSPRSIRIVLKVAGAAEKEASSSGGDGPADDPSAAGSENAQ